MRAAECPYCALAAAEGDGPRCGLHSGTAAVPADAYRAPEVCRLAGCSYRQLDYWTATGVVAASYGSARGSGTQRLYSPADVDAVCTVAGLRRHGLTLAAVRAIAPATRGRLLHALDAATADEGVAV